MRENGSARAVREVLARRGWKLTRGFAAYRSRFTVTRLDGGRDLFEIDLEGSPGAERSLTPRARLRARTLAAPRDGEAEALGDLLAALGRWLESRRRAPAGESALAESHAGARGADLLLRTTFACNQRCAFCFVPLTGRAAPFPEIERELDAQALRSGARGELTLSGGEPASDPRLPAIVAAARHRGFRRFVLQTNAVYLSRPGLLETLTALGVKSFLVSFHSHKEKSYDRVTGSRGQFARAAAGLTRVLRAPGCDATVNIVVNKENYRDLPGLVDFVARRRGKGARGRAPSVYFSMINEAGHLKAPEWAVDLKDAAPFLRRAVARCRAAGFPVARAGGESSFPVCLLDEPARHAARGPQGQERVRYAEAFEGEDGAVGRAKRPACRACAYDARCPGVPAAYARRFGLGALGPARRRRA